MRSRYRTASWGSRNMNSAWLLALLTFVCMPGPGPGCAVTVVDIKKEFCPNPAVIPLRLKNSSAEPVLVSLMIEKRNESGRWDPFVLDLFAEQAFPQQSAVVTLGAHAERSLMWRPPMWMSREPLGVGRYRIVAAVSRRLDLPFHSCVVAEFAVSKRACR
jgi:hypothetical protein